MSIHYYNPVRYEFFKPPHQFLTRRWFEDLGVPFPPEPGTYYNHELRVLFSGGGEFKTKTPPPWIGKVR